MKKRFILSLFAMILFVFNMDVSHATLIKFNELVQNQDNAELLAQVDTLDITTNNLSETHEIENNLSLISRLPNLENLSITANGITLDKTLFQYINTSKKFTLSLGCGSIDLKDAYNSKLKRIGFSEVKVYNFDNILNFTNLENINIFQTKGFQVVDFNRLPNLKSFTFQDSVEDYSSFFDKIKNIENLSLESSNIQSSDLKYLSKLTKLKTLSLENTFVYDISGLINAPTIESIFLPSDVKNFDVLYRMPNLNGVWFDSITEYKMTQELTNYFSSKNINYTQYDTAIKQKIDSIISDLNIPSNATDEEKIDIVSDYVRDHMEVSGEPINDAHTAIDRTVNYGKGVCHHYATLMYTLLRLVGVEAYYVSGSGKNAARIYVNEYDIPGAHAWNVVNIDGNWYGIDVMWTDTESENMINILKTQFYMKKATYEDIENDPFYDDMNTDADKVFALTHITYNNPEDTLRNSGNFEDEQTNIDNSQYTITIDAVGGIIPVTEGWILSSDGKTATKLIDSGSTYGILPAPTKSGYTFNGWFTAKNGGLKVTNSTIANSNIIVYAQWRKVTPSNPKTGIFTPIISLIVLGIISCTTFIVVMKKNSEINI